MSRIRIFLIDLPPALDGVVRSWLGREEDMALVDDLAGADMAMVAAPEAEHARVCRELLDRHARLRVLVLDPESGAACTCRLEPSRSELGVLPLAQLSDVIRSAMRPTRAD